MRSKLGVSAFILLLTGCGAFESGSDAPADTDVDAPSRDHDPVKGTPSDGELTEANGVFVVTSAAPNGDGTRTLPFASLAPAIALAKASGRRVFACAGTYKEQLVVEDGVSMIGNLDCAVPETWKIAAARSRIEAPTTLAIRANGIVKATRIEGFDVFAADATEPSRSSIGLWAVGAPGLVITNATIHAGKGARGADGTEGVQLVLNAAAAGTTGTPARPCTGVTCFAVATMATAGGRSLCEGEPGHNGEDGGNGGARGLYEKYWNGTALKSLFRPISDDRAYAAQPAPPGANGANGADGANGSSAASWGALTRDGFMQADGTPGTDATPGRGGSGGRGYDPHYLPPDHEENQNHYGNGGGGGGAGGCPGLKGTPGKGGGASIAALLVDSALTFDSVDLVSAAGGDGGKGSFGSHYTAGGAGGGASGDARPGQPGGRGGISGISGSGAGGPSFALAHTGGEPKLVATKTTAGSPGAAVPVLTKSVDGAVKTIPASVNGASAVIQSF